MRQRLPHVPRRRRARDRLDGRPRDDAHAPARRVRVPVRDRRDERRRGAGGERAGPRGQLRASCRYDERYSPRGAGRATAHAAVRTPRGIGRASRPLRRLGDAGAVRAASIDEVRAVRTAAGVFDVSHMGQVQVGGSGAHAFLQGVLSNDLDRLSPGEAQYTLLTNERGGIVDDLIAYRREGGYLLVVNAGNRAADVAHLSARCPGRRDARRRVRRARHARAPGPGGARAARAAVRGHRPALGRGLHVRRGARRGRRLHGRAHRLHRRAGRRADLRRRARSSSSGTR